MKPKYLKNIKQFKPCALAIGVFDGVHRGHQEILKETKRIASKLKLTPSVLTFWPHPLKVLGSGTAPPLIINLEDRIKIIKKTGIEQIVVTRFTKDFSRKKARAFLEDILLKKLNAKWIIVGSGYRFGRGVEGDKELLLKLSGPYGFGVSLVSQLKLDNHKVSSSLIRSFLAKGQVQKAAKHLGRYYFLEGKVLRGSQRGKILGFPTINLSAPSGLLVRDGVYAGLVLVGGKRRKAVINIGRRPTFASGARIIEAHIFNFNRNIYGKTIEVSFLKRLRSEEKFKDKNALMRQIKKDSLRAKKFLKNLDL